MSYLHFTLKERIKIEIFYEMGYSNRKIAGILGRSHTSVSREIKRNVDLKSKYKAENAHKNYQINKSKCGRKGKFTKELSEIISGKFLLGTPISKRPKEIKKRIFFGHYELDTMVSSRGKSKGCFATFCEMKSRYFLALKLPDRSSESNKLSIKNLSTRSV